MAFQVFIKSEPDPLHEEPKIKVEDLHSLAPTEKHPLTESKIKIEELEATPGPSAAPPTKKPHLKPVRKKICIRKADTRQCRLCLRVLSREDVRETTSPKSDLRRKIMDAVAVKITAEDKVRTVCINCLLLVDMIYEFRMACKKANTLHALKLLMMHPGSWMSEENKTAIEACHRVVKRNRAEMDGLFKCSWMGGGDVKEFRGMQKEVLLDGGDAPKVVDKDEISDSDPEMSEKFGKQMDQDTQQDEIEASSDESPVKKEPSNRSMCEFCGSLVMRHHVEHHKNEHLGLKPYSCRIEGCEATFHSYMAMHLHCKNEQKHTSTAERHKKIQCDVCHRMIKNKNMKKHMWAQHSDKPVHPLKALCTVCGKYYYKLYIKDHMATHTGELPHGCEFCGRRFAANNSLTIHRRRYHSDQLDLQ